MQQVAVAQASCHYDALNWKTLSPSSQNIFFYQFIFYLFLSFTSTSVNIHVHAAGLGKGYLKPMQSPHLHTRWHVWTPQGVASHLVTCIQVHVPSVSHFSWYSTIMLQPICCNHWLTWYMYIQKFTVALNKCYTDSNSVKSCILSCKQKMNQMFYRHLWPCVNQYPWLILHRHLIDISSLIFDPCRSWSTLGWLLANCWLRSIECPPSIDCSINL